MGVGLFVQLVLLPHLLPDLHAGYGLLRGYDYLGFHRIAEMLADRMHAEGFSAWELRPHRQAIAGILGFLYWLAIPSPVVMLPINAMLFGLSAFLIHRIALTVIGDEHGALAGAMLFILFPSSMLWYAQMHNDAFFVPGLLLQIWAWIILATGRWQSAGFALTVAIAASVAIWIVRPYFLPVTAFANLVAAAALLLFERRAGSLSRLTLIASLFVLVPLALWKGAPASESRFYVLNDKVPSATDSPTQAPDKVVTAPSGVLVPEGAEDSASAHRPPKPRSTRAVQQRPPLTERAARLIDQKRQAMVRQGTRKQAGSDIHTEVRFHTMSDVFQFMPKAVSAGLLAPYPDTWFAQARKPGGDIMRKLTAIEMLLAYTSIIALAWAVVTRRIRLGLLSVLMAFCLTLIIVWGTTIPNVGTLYRMRMGPWMLIVCLGWAVLYRSLATSGAKRS
jgi:hypothetical protein